MSKVKYIIEGVQYGKGFYVDVYVGTKRITTKTANCIEELYILIDKLESQIETLTTGGSNDL